MNTIEIIKAQAERKKAIITDTKGDRTKKVLEIYRTLKPLLDEFDLVSKFIDSEKIPPKKDVFLPVSLQVYNSVSDNVYEAPFIKVSVVYSVGSIKQPCTVLTVKTDLKSNLISVESSFIEGLGTFVGTFGLVKEVFSKTLAKIVDHNYDITKGLQSKYFEVEWE